MISELSKSAILVLVLRGFWDERKMRLTRRHPKNRFIWATWSPAYKLLLSSEHNRKGLNMLLLLLVSDKSIEQINVVEENVLLILIGEHQRLIAGPYEIQ